MRVRLFLTLAMALATTQPATAQIFWQSPDYRGAALVPGEPNMGVVLPGATVAEERANWAWQMRAALNVAKLQCKFDYVFLAADSYDGVYINHAIELAAAYETLRKYFVRTNKGVRAAQGALDKYGTRTYSSFSTVSGQFGFCQTAGRIGRKALFAPRGGFTIFAVENLREMRNSLGPGVEQFFRRTRLLHTLATPSLDPACWDRRQRYIARCGTVYL
jgi:hypothetical protein